MTHEVIELTDTTSGATAAILPGFGMNCFQFQVPTADGVIDVLWSEEGFANGKGRASGSGIPILFPFPGRILKGQLDFRGKVYELQEADGLGNAIHGFVIDRQWRVTNQTATSVQAEFQLSVDAEELLPSWPADFIIRITYQLQGKQLISKFVCSNPDSQDLPCGLGTHPYFAVPLDGSNAADCEIKLPVSSQWELKDLIASGNRIDLPQAAQFNRGMKFSETSFDNVFSGLSFDDDGYCRAAIVDPHSDCQMLMQFSDAFRECVVYNPPHREAICIEPYTCVPDAQRLADQGIDAGLRILQPGESFSAEVTMGIS